MEKKVENTKDGGPQKRKLSDLTIEEPKKQATSPISEKEAGRLLVKKAATVKKIDTRRP